MVIGEKISVDNLDELVKNHMGFIIRKVSNITGRYVSVENDDEFSIALSAFAEAVERYDSEKGNFLSFAGIVIDSRLKTYLEQNNKYKNDVSLDELSENGQDFAKEDDNKEDLIEEINEFKSELIKFGLTLDDLAEKSPKHSDTRKRAITIAETSSKESKIVKLTYQKKKLPIREVSKKCNVTEKIVKGSKHFILATMLVFVKKFPVLVRWIKETRCYNE